MPFGRTDVRHGLHDAIFGFEISTQRVGELSDLMKAIAQAIRPGIDSRGKEIDPPPPLWRRFQREDGLKDFLPLGRVLPDALRAFDRELLPLCLRSRDALQTVSSSWCRDAGCDALELAMTLHSFGHLGVIGVSSGRRVIFLAHQFVPRLCPIRLGKLVRVRAHRSWRFLWHVFPLPQVTVRRFRGHAPKFSPGEVASNFP
jgi:hypothetical protein